jgi:hypothetical protein
MTAGDVRALTDVMCGAFRGTPDERPRARVAKYLLDQLDAGPESVCLVGLIGGGDDSDSGGGSGSGGGGSSGGGGGGGGGESVTDDAGAETDDPGADAVASECANEGQPIAIVSLSFTQKARGGPASSAAAKANPKP